MLTSSNDLPKFPVLRASPVLQHCPVEVIVHHPTLAVGHSHNKILLVWRLPRVERHERASSTGLPSLLSHTVLRATHTWACSVLGHVVVVDGLVADEEVFDGFGAVGVHGCVAEAVVEAQGLVVLVVAIVVV